MSTEIGALLNRGDLVSAKAFHATLQRVNKNLAWYVGFVLGLVVLSLLAPAFLQGQQGQFHIEESSITDIQNAIRSGQTTCEGVVRAYLERAKAYNGACTALLTKDGTPIPQATGMIRAG